MAHVHKPYASMDFLSANEIRNCPGHLVLDCSNNLHTCLHVVCVCIDYRGFRMDWKRANY